MTLANLLEAQDTIDFVSFYDSVQPVMTPIFWMYFWLAFSFFQFTSIKFGILCIQKQSVAFVGP